MTRRPQACWIAITLLACGACSAGPQTPSPLPPRPVSPDYTGNYKVSLAIGESCNLPPYARTRKYTATIDDSIHVYLADAEFGEGGRSE